jgi:hypothetical protein
MEQSVLCYLPAPEMPASIPRVTLHSDRTLHVLIHYLKETSLPEQCTDTVVGSIEGTDPFTDLQKHRTQQTGRTSDMQGGMSAAKEEPNNSNRTSACNCLTDVANSVKIPDCISFLRKKYI